MFFIAELANHKADFKSNGKLLFRGIIGIEPISSDYESVDFPLIYTPKKLNQVLLKYDW